MDKFLQVFSSSSVKFGTCREPAWVLLTSLFVDQCEQLVLGCLRDSVGEFLSKPPAGHITSTQLSAGPRLWPFVWCLSVLSSRNSVREQRLCMVWPDRNEGMYVCIYVCVCVCVCVCVIGLREWLYTWEERHWCKICSLIFHTQTESAEQAIINTEHYRNGYKLNYLAQTGN